MGLDISVYENLKLVKCPTEDEKDNLFHIYTGFPEQLDDIIDGSYYQYDYNSDLSFRAGSYGGYNYWRNQLAELAGYGSAKFVWDENNDLGEKRYFVELINFSDCEGVIGPKTSEKLYKDFIQFDNRAKEVDEIFYNIYCCFKDAFYYAYRKNGCVRFH